MIPSSAVSQRRSISRVKCFASWVNECQQGFVVGVSSGGRPIEAPRDHCIVVDHGELVMQLVAASEAGCRRLVLVVLLKDLLRCLGLSWVDKEPSQESIGSRVETPRATKGYWIC